MTPESHAGTVPCRPESVSVIIATRNGSREILRSLSSLLAGNVVPDEVVVLDQSDDDRTRRKVEEAQRLPGGDRIRYLHSTRPGLCAHRNDALAAANGDFIASIDDDVAVPSDWLERMLQEWTQQWQRGDVLITGRILRGPEIGPDDLVTAIVEHPERRVIRGRRVPCGIFVGAQFGAPRTLFRRLEPMPFDERLGVGARFSGADDDEFAYRVQLLDAPIVYEPSIWCTHHTVRVTGWRKMTYTRAIGTGAAMAKHFFKGDRRMLAELLRYVAIQWVKAFKAVLKLEEPEGSSRLIGSAGVIVGFGKWALDHATGRLEPEDFRQPGQTPDLGIDVRPAEQRSF
jgi:glycosyltransferase involved in cell wall biosynthesis